MQQQLLNSVIPISQSVFITGANGYIGRAVAVAFARKGYRVFGLVRSVQKAEQAWLQQEEIIPVIGDALQPETYQEYIKKSGIIIDCSGGATSEKIELLLKLTTESGETESNQKKVYIQTTGFKLYPYEKLITQNESIFGCVIRPGFIYGGRGGIVLKCFFTQQLFENKYIVGPQANSGDVVPWAHVNELADVYFSVAENKQKAQGNVFRVGSIDQNVITQEVRRKSALLLGHNEEIITNGVIENPLETIINHWHNVLLKNEGFDTSNTQNILGYKPRPILVYNNLDFYYQAYLASQNCQN